VPSGVDTCSSQAVEPIFNIERPVNRLARNCRRYDGSRVSFFSSRARERLDLILVSRPGIALRRLFSYSMTTSLKSRFVPLRVNRTAVSLSGE